MISDYDISLDAPYTVISLITLPDFSFETSWQILISEIANCVVKRLDYPYLGSGFGSKYRLLVSLTGFVIECLAKVDMWLQ